jgi:hypothetical protein
MLLFALIAFTLSWTAPGTRGQSAPSTAISISDAKLLARDALNLEKQGRSLEAQEKYESIAQALATGFYSEDLVAAASYLDAARMRIKGGGQYGENINRESNLKAIFSELKQAETLLNGAEPGRLSPLARRELENSARKMTFHPSAGAPCLVDGRKLLLARVYFARGNLDQSGVEIETSLGMFRNIEKNCPNGDPTISEMISYVSAVERQVTHSPFSRDNLIKTAEALSKLVPDAGAFLPSLIELVNQWALSHQQPPPL